MLLGFQNDYFVKSDKKSITIMVTRLKFGCVGLKCKKLSDVHSIIFLFLK